MEALKIACIPFILGQDKNEPKPAVIVATQLASLNMHCCNWEQSKSMHILFKTIKYHKVYM